MIRRGEVYNARLNRSSQLEVLVLVVSNDASNRSALPFVAVLEVEPYHTEVAQGFKVVFEVVARRVKVQPHTLATISKEELVGEPVATLEGAVCQQIDALLARHLALYPAGPPNIATRERGERP